MLLIILNRIIYAFIHAVMMYFLWPIVVKNNPEVFKELSFYSYFIISLIATSIIVSGLSLYRMQEIK